MKSKVLLFVMRYSLQFLFICVFFLMVCGFLIVFVLLGRGHQRLPVLRAGHPISENAKENKYFCDQLSEFCGLETVALPVIVESKDKDKDTESKTAIAATDPSNNVRVWTPAQLQQAVCARKPHFASLFDFELKDLDGASFLALQTADSFLSRGVEVRSRREWLAQLSAELAVRQKLFDDATKGVRLRVCSCVCLCFTLCGFRQEAGRYQGGGGEGQRCCGESRRVSLVVRV